MFQNTVVCFMMNLKNIYIFFKLTEPVLLWYFPNRKTFCGPRDHKTDRLTLYRVTTVIMSQHISIFQTVHFKLSVTKLHHC